ncbi:hypothetical protein IG631_20748 [Alternaria alternata]|nr:hypothetical protein IG631_20748 [Alternaria alternata]
MPPSARAADQRLLFAHHFSTSTLLELLVAPPPGSLLRRCACSIFSGTGLLADFDIFEAKPKFEWEAGLPIKRSISWASLPSSPTQMSNDSPGLNLVRLPRTTTNLVSRAGCLQISRLRGLESSLILRCVCATSPQALGSTHISCTNLSTGQSLM